MSYNNLSYFAVSNWKLILRTDLKLSNLTYIIIFNERWNFQNISTNFGPSSLVFHN